MTQSAEKRIVFMGSPDFAVPSLKALLRNGFQVAAVVTQPDKPKGRSKTPVPTPVKECALEAGIPVLQPARVRNEDFIEELRTYRPDLIVVAAFGQIIPKAVLEMAPFGCINVHGSLLPKYRGASPIQQAVIDGEEKSGITIMKMSEGLDTGDIISQQEIRLAADETGGSLFDKLSVSGAELLVKTIPAVFDGSAVYTKQPEKSPTAYASLITKKQGRLDFEKDALSLERLVRGLSPWPGACTGLNGRTLKIWKCRAEDASSSAGELSGTGEEGAEKPPAGTVLRCSDDGIFVLCGSGILVLQEVQLEGKKRMDVAAFLRGFRLEPGCVLA